MPSECVYFQARAREPCLEFGFVFFPLGKLKKNKTNNTQSEWERGRETKTKWRREWISYLMMMLTKGQMCGCTLILISNRKFTMCTCLGGCVWVCIGALNRWRIDWQTCATTYNNRLFIHFYYTSSRPFLFIVYTFLFSVLCLFFVSAVPSIRFVRNVLLWFHNFDKSDPSVYHCNRDAIVATADTTEMRIERPLHTHWDKYKTGQEC